MNTMQANRRAFTIAEVLFALGAGATLIGAIASALFTGAHSMKSNSDFAQATNTAREALRAIGTAVRVSHACDVEAGRSMRGTLSGNVLYITPFASDGSAGSRVAYVYDAAKRQLLLDTVPVNPPVNEAALAGIRARMAGSAIAPTVFLLAEKVESCTFSGAYDQRSYSVPIDPQMRLVNVDVKLRVNVNGASLDVAESVVPRTSYDQ